MEDSEPLIEKVWNQSLSILEDYNKIDHGYVMGGNYEARIWLSKGSENVEYGLVIPNISEEVSREEIRETVNQNLDPRYVDENEDIAISGELEDLNDVSNLERAYRKVISE